jgi:hypothetical protein
MSLSDFKNIEDVSLIINRNLPDKNQEVFWYGFKNSIINLINNVINNLTNNLKTSNNIHLEKEVIEKLNTILKEVNDKSNLLNNYQKNEDYENINLEIEKYIKWISRYLFIKYADFYHFNILFTNLKRWTKWIINKECDKEFNNLIDSPKIEKKHKKSDKIDLNWLKDEFNEFNERDDFFIIFFNLLKYCYEYEYNKNDESEKTIINQIILNLKKYNPELFYSNKAILDNILNLILVNKFFKPLILIEFSKYYNINEKLKVLGYIKNDVPDNWTVEKIFKKQLLNHL